MNIVFSGFLARNRLDRYIYGSGFLNGFSVFTMQSFEQAVDVGEKLIAGMGRYFIRIVFEGSG